MEQREITSQVGNAYTNDSNQSGVSWPPVIAGAFVAAALALILLALGTGIGMSSISPWAGSGVSGKAVAAGAIVWFVLIEMMACAMGGYLAGRLRTKWVNVHSHEVYFRDTAHGFLVWAVSLVITAAFLASAATSVAGGAAQRNAAGIASTGTGESVLNPNAYMVDMLFRSNGAPNDRNDVAGRAEAERIFSHSMREQALSATDRNYLGQMVAARTGLSQSDAEA